MSSALAVFVELDFVENEHAVAFRSGPRHVDVALFERAFEAQDCVEHLSSPNTLGFQHTFMSESSYKFFSALRLSNGI
jgi:hypothetical protein